RYCWIFATVPLERIAGRRKLFGSGGRGLYLAPAIPCSGTGMRASLRHSWRGRRRWLLGRLGLAGIAAALALSPAALRAQNVVNLTFGEIKFGAGAHDVSFLGGKEHGVDFNPELIMPSPVADAWAASLP